MRRLRMAGTVVAGACAAALTVSLAACTPVSKSAGAPFATMFPSTGTAPDDAPGTGAPTHATGSGNGHAAGSGLVRVIGARRRAPRAIVSSAYRSSVGVDGGDERSGR